MLGSKHTFLIILSYLLSYHHWMMQCCGTMVKLPCKLQLSFDIHDNICQHNFCEIGHIVWSLLLRPRNLVTSYPCTVNYMNSFEYRTPTMKSTGAQSANKLHWNDSASDWKSVSLTAPNGPCPTIAHFSQHWLINSLWQSVVWRQWSGSTLA